MALRGSARRPEGLGKTMDSLDFEFHLKRYKDLLAVNNEEAKQGAMNSALEDHQLAVRLELSNFTERA
jgi:hypothetical protein